MLFGHSAVTSKATTSAAVLTRATLAVKLKAMSLSATPKYPVISALMPRRPIDRLRSRTAKPPRD